MFAVFSRGILHAVFRFHAHALNYAADACSQDVEIVDVGDRSLPLDKSQSLDNMATSVATLCSMHREFSSKQGVH